MSKLYTYTLNFKYYQIVMYINNQIKIYNNNILNFNQPIFDKWSYLNLGTPTLIIIKNNIDNINFKLKMMFELNIINDLILAVYKYILYT